MSKPRLIGEIIAKILDDLRPEKSPNESKEGSDNEREQQTPEQPQ